MRVIAAMSGGVDSAVAAARCVDAGYDVVGVHLAMARSDGGGRARGCCSADDARDARRAADALDIPFYVWDVSEEFSRHVIDDFVAEYEQGNTPHPCLRCNESIKFSVVLDRALSLGFDAVCTGHYARVVETAAGPELHRARDAAKDQSYVLSVLGSEQLRAALFPLGDDLKAAVREEANQRGLAVADKPDSHDICFVPDGGTAQFLRDRLGERPGAIVDARSGTRIGEHRGAYAFTVGQRRGLGLTVPEESGARRYVVDIDAATGQVTVGAESLLSVEEISGERPRWCGPVPGSPFAADVQLRAHGEPIPATVTVASDGVTAHLSSPARGIAKGQAMALYDGTRVIGSATIAAARPRSPSGAVPPTRRRPGAREHRS